MYLTLDIFEDTYIEMESLATKLFKSRALGFFPKKRAMIKWSKGLLLAFLGLLSAIVPVGIATATNANASANNSSGTFQFLAGTGPLCSIPGVKNPCPDVARADNGDMVQIAGQGSLSIHTKSVTGNGTFVHMAPDGTVRAMGTWTAMRLMSFKSFGNSTGFPANFVGGQAIMLVQLSVGGTPVHTAVLTIICDLGTPPHGLMEGVKLAVQDTPFNFNKQVSGITVFISQA